MSLEEMQAKLPDVKESVIAKQMGVATVKPRRKIPGIKGRAVFMDAPLSEAGDVIAKKGGTEVIPGKTCRIFRED